MKNKFFMVLLFFIIIAFSCRLLFLQYQKNQIVYHTNQHISLLKQIGNEIEEKPILEGDEEYLEHIFVLLLEADNEYNKATLIRNEYNLWGGSFTSSYRLITDVLFNLLDCIDNIDNIEQEKLLYVQSDLSNIALYMEKHYPEGIKKYKDTIYGNTQWTDYEEEVMNYGLGRFNFD